jgi:hypothetical protein
MGKNDASGRVITFDVEDIEQTPRQVEKFFKILVRTILFKKQFYT